MAPVTVIVLSRCFFLRLEHIPDWLEQFYYSDVPETLGQVSESTFQSSFHANKLTFPVPTPYKLSITNLNHSVMTKRVHHSYNYRVSYPAIIPSTVMINDASVLKVISVETFPVTVGEAKNGCE